MVAVLRAKDTKEVKILSEDDFCSFLRGQEKDNVFCAQSFVASKGNEKSSHRTYGYTFNRSSFKEMA